MSLTFMMKCPKAAAGKLLSIFLLVLWENSEFCRLAHAAVVARAA
jgi:hypothetical protein